MRRNSAFFHNHSSSPSWPALAQGFRRAKNTAVGPKEAPTRHDQAPEVTVETHWHTRFWPDSENTAIKTIAIAVHCHCHCRSLPLPLPFTAIAIAVHLLSGCIQMWKALFNLSQWLWMKNQPCYLNYDSEKMALNYDSEKLTLNHAVCIWVIFPF